MDLTRAAVGPLTSAHKNFRQDLEAIPESAFAQTFGGKSRTVADIVYEVNMVNDDVARCLRGEPMVDWPEGWLTAPDGLRDKASALASFDASSAAVMATVSPFTEADLETKVTTEYGETTKFERCRFMTLHLWYHSGQLNFIQTLLGDDAKHWA